MYAYLRVETGEWDRVSFPDGTQERVERGTGAQVAADWRSEQAEEKRRETRASPSAPEALVPPGDEEREAAQRVYAERHTQWQQALDHALDGALSIAHVRLIRAEFTKTHPEPTLDDTSQRPDTPDAPDTEPIPIPEITLERQWIARLAEFEPPFEVVLGPHGPYPRPAVARTLTELERRGWTVVHVTEDRSVRHTDAGAQVDVVGAWVLLHSPA